MMRLADLVAAFPRTSLNIELKVGDPRLLAGVLHILRDVPPQQVVLAAEHDAIMAQIEAAQAPFGLSMARGQLHRAVRQAFFGRPPCAFAGRAMQIPPRHRGLPLAGRRLLERMHAGGLEVHLWVIDDPKRAQRYLSRGVDGIMSDDPGALLEVVHAYRS